MKSDSLDIYVAIDIFLLLLIGISRKIAVVLFLQVAAQSTAMAAQGQHRVNESTVFSTILCQIIGCGTMTQLVAYVRMPVALMRDSRISLATPLSDPPVE